MTKPILIALAVLIIIGLGFLATVLLKTPNPEKPSDKPPIEKSLPPGGKTDSKQRETGFQRNSHYRYKSYQ